MKILIVIPTLGFGGAERLIVTLIKKLHMDKHQVRVCVFSPPLDLANEIEKENIPVINLSLRHRWSFIEAVYKLNLQVKEFKPEIIWGHLYFGILYSRITTLFNKNLKSVSLLHYNISSDSSKKGLWYSFRNWIFNKSRCLDFKTVAVSKSVKNDYEKYFGWKNIKVVYNAINFNIIDNAIDKLDIDEVRKRYQLQKKEFVIVLPGRLHLSKGHIYLIDAIKEINDNNNYPIKVIFAGDGDLKNDLINYISKKNLEKIFILTGNLKQDELFRVIRSSDIVVIPSLFEAFGIVLIESMYLEKPIIVTEIDGLKEISRNDFDTIQVPAKDSHSIANAIIQLLEDKVTNNKIKSNAKETAKEYNIDNIINNWYKIFNEELK